MRRHKKSTALLAVIVLLLIIPLASIKGDTGVTTDAKIVVNDYQLVDVEQQPSGKADAVKVIDWLALDGNGTVTIDRPSGFADPPKVQPLNGFTTPEVKGNDLIWKDVSVNGARNLTTMNTLNKQSQENELKKLPLEVEYKYWLDGNRVKNLNDIAGKSGHFRMELYMKNTSKTKKLVTYKDSVTGQEKSEIAETYLPLVIQPTNWFFDNTIYHNMKVDPTGLIFYLPTVYQPGWVVPLFPPATGEDFTIWMEADVTKFAMDPLSLAVAFVYPHTNQTDPIPTFAAGLTQLNGGVAQLGAGLAQAVAGLGSASTDQTLLFGINAILGGLNQLAGSEGLPKAEAALTGQLIPGVEQINAGLGSTTTPDTLLYGVGQITDGLAQMQAGIGSPTTPDTLLFGANALTGGLNTISAGIGSPTTPNTLLFATNAVTGGLNQIAAGIGSASTPNTLLYATNAVTGGLQQIEGGIGTASTPNTLLYATNQVSGGLSTIKSSIGNTGNPSTLQGGLQYMKTKVGVTTDSPLSSLEGGLQFMKTSIGTISDPPTVSLEGGMQYMKAGAQTILAALTDNPPPGFLGGAQQLASGATTLKLMLQMFAAQGDPSSLTSMWTAANDVYTGLSPGGDLYTLVQGLADPTDANKLMANYATLSKNVRDAYGSIWAMLSTAGWWGAPVLDQVQGMIDGANQMIAALGTGPSPDPLHTLRGGLMNMIASIGTPDPTQKTVLGGLEAIKAGIGTPNPLETSALGGLEAIKAGIGVADPMQTSLLGGLEAIKAGIGTSGTPNTLLFGTNAITLGLQQIKDAIGSSTTPDTLLFGTHALTGGLAEILTAIGSATTPDSLLYGMNATSGGLTQTQAGIGSATTPNTLLFGANAISGGLTQMSQGIGSVTTANTLLFGSNAVFSGLSTLRANVSTGSMANPGLLEGLVQLDQGTQQAVAGLGSESNSNSLIGGASQINTGLSQLQQGLLQAVNSGTNVMQAALTDNIKQLDLTVGQLALTEQLGEDFDSFMGRVTNTGSNSEFRVLMQTKPVQAPQNNNLWIWELIFGVVAAILIVVLGSFVLRRFNT